MGSTELINFDLVLHIIGMEKVQALGGSWLKKQIINLGLPNLYLQRGNSRLL